MHQIYDTWPELAKESYKSVGEELDFKNIDHIVFSGMGGSGTIGDIFSSILSKSNIHTTVVKGYTLPNTVDSNTLVITTSVSGNTKETLSALNLASKLECKIVAFSNGGKMQKFCQKNKIVHYKIHSMHSPRASLVLFLYSMLRYLGPMFKIKKGDIKESLEILLHLQEKITSSNLSDDNPSLNLAMRLTGTPIIYYPWGLHASAIRFKNSLQENAKLHAMAEDMMESTHNGIVAWEKSSHLQPVLIQGQNDFIKTKERWLILKEFLKSKEINYLEVFSCHGNILSKLVYLIYLLDYSTLYKSFLLKRDPTPILGIDFVKKRITA
jgi:glucose/mannose-6-phosphate isomerase